MKLEQVDEEYVLREEKDHDKARRDELRVKRLEAQKEAYAHRLQVPSRAIRAVPCGLGVPWPKDGVP